MLQVLKKKEAELSKSRRYKKTLNFIQNSQNTPKTLFDIGTPNELGAFLYSNGFTVINTEKIDLDIHPEAVQPSHQADAATAFEIFEHLINPMGVLQNITCDHLFASIPLRLWFSKAYRNRNNEWDQHYHEFEDWQFDWLLAKSGWSVIRREKWTNPPLVPGIRPLLRLFTPRYYIVEAKRIK